MCKLRVVEKLAQESASKSESKLSKALPVLAVLGAGGLVGAGATSLATPAIMKHLGKNYDYDDIVKIHRRLLAAGSAGGILGGAGLVGLLKKKKREQTEKALGGGLSDSGKNK